MIPSGVIVQPIAVLKEGKEKLMARFVAGRRRGNVLVLTALLTVGFFAIAALVVDLGYVMVVRGDMQSASDAAALAGAALLFDRDELTGAPNQAEELNDARLE